MAPLTWRNVDAPDFGRAGEMLNNAGRNWGNAFDGLSDNVQGIRDRQRENISAEGMALLSGIGTEGDVDGTLAQIQGMMSNRDMTPELRQLMMAARGNALSMDASRAQIAHTEAQAARARRPAGGGAASRAEQERQGNMEYLLSNLSGSDGEGASPEQSVAAPPSVDPVAAQASRGVGPALPDFAPEAAIANETRGLSEADMLRQAVGQPASVPQQEASVPMASENLNALLAQYAGPQGQAAAQDRAAPVEPNAQSVFAAMYEQEGISSPAAQEERPAAQAEPATVTSFPNPPRFEPTPPPSRREPTRQEILSTGGHTGRLSDLNSRIEREHQENLERHRLSEEARRSEEEAANAQERADYMADIVARGVSQSGINSPEEFMEWVNRDREEDLSNDQQRQISEYLLNNIDTVAPLMRTPEGVQLPEEISRASAMLDVTRRIDGLGGENSVSDVFGGTGSISEEDITSYLGVPIENAPTALQAFQEVHQATGLPREIIISKYRDALTADTGFFGSGGGIFRPELLEAALGDLLIGSPQDRADALARARDELHSREMQRSGVQRGISRATELTREIARLESLDTPESLRNRDLARAELDGLLETLDNFSDTAVNGEDLRGEQASQELMSSMTPADQGPGWGDGATDYEQLPIDDMGRGVIDPDSSGLMTGLRRHFRQDNIRAAMSQIANDLGRQGGSWEWGALHGAVDFATQNAATRAEQSARREELRVARDWFSSEGATRFFNENPHLIEVASEDPVTFFQENMINREE